MEDDLTIPTRTELSVLGDRQFIPDGHEKMLSTIQDHLPTIVGDTENFGKRQSAFMDNMLTVTQPTPIRRARQILSEIERSLSALRGNYYRHKKLKIRYQIALKKAKEEPDPLMQEMWAIRAEEMSAGVASGKKYISGAVRKIAQYIEQYNSILKEAGKENFTEEDFEKEEEEYHIKTAFVQALCAARSNGGRIDEGNHIYLYQIGVNGAVAQKEIEELLLHEQKLLREGQQPGHQLILAWLDRVYRNHKGCAEEYAKIKGQQGTFRPAALLEKAKEALALEV